MRGLRLAFIFNQSERFSILKMFLTFPCTLPGSPYFIAARKDIVSPHLTYILPYINVEEQWSLHTNRGLDQYTVLNILRSFLP
jgi:hypothetical protein